MSQPSDPTFVDLDHPTARAALRFLDDPAAAVDSALTPGDDEPHEEEILGLLNTLAAVPEALDRATIAPGGRQRLLAAVANDSSATVRPFRREQRSPADARPIANRPVTTSSAAQQSSVVGGGFPRWLMPLAAALVAAVLTLGFTTWDLTRQIQQQSLTVAHLTEALDQQQFDARSQLASQRQVEELERSFSMITDVAAQLYPLRPPGQRASLENRDLRGVIYVCSFHQRWYVNLQGLPQAQPGQRYVLWFETPDGPIPAASLDVEPGIPAEMQAPSMPANTTGFRVTLEPEARDQPLDLACDGPVVLQSTNSVLL